MNLNPNEKTLLHSLNRKIKVNLTISHLLSLGKDKL